MEEAEDELRSAEMTDHEAGRVLVELVPRGRQRADAAVFEDNDEH